MRYTETMASVNLTYFKNYFAGIKRKIRDDSNKLDIIVSEMTDQSL